MGPWLQLAMIIFEIIKLILERWKKDPVLAKSCRVEMDEALKARDFPRLERLRDRLKAEIG